MDLTGRSDLFGFHGRRPPEASAAGPGGGQALVGAIDNQFADELGERGEDMENKTLPPIWRAKAATRPNSPPRASPRMATPTQANKRWTAWRFASTGLLSFNS
ncbi:hypothetical protein ACIBQ0_03695 [Nocardia nova]|uniref:hypothetical protein n=1 Tax=Nocardia nova TaxID=37330 RepID=UPI0037B75389